MKANYSKGSFKVGDWVEIDFGRRKLAGEVVEDRGAIGVKGRRVFQVRIPMDPLEPMMVELPEDEMDVLSNGPRKSPQIPSEKVMEYLVNGGLIAILRANIAGGRDQPRIWLCWDNLGNVTHTFYAERGIVGGQTVPFWAEHENRIFTPKQSDVASFIESFGLTHQEAESVISKVGTAP